MGTERSVDVIAEEARGLLAELAGADMTGLPAGAVTDMTSLTGEITKLADAAHVVAVGRLDVTRAWEASGARSAAAWVGWQCHLDKARATSSLTCARRLRHLPGAEAAFRAGQISADHVRLLHHAYRADPEAYAADEARLVFLAGDVLFSRFEKIIRYWIYAHDHDHAEGDARSHYETRRVDASVTFEGTVVLDGILDPIGGGIFMRELERLEQALFDADWADARARLGDTATKDDLARTPKQRRADALRIMAQRSAAKPADAKDGRVLLQVLAGHESVNRMCELSNGTVVTPGEVLPLLNRADVERVIFDGPSKVLDVGVRQRLFTGATRTAVEVRDLTCEHDSCDVPAERCEIDHIVPYPAGGLTVQVNGRCRCPYHHRWRHRQHPPAA